ncbi:pyridine nucleotide-disulfide oxidoreductase domain 1 [Tachypleus tridentatus]|uniref:pyridine nucleotide-disulfide oxidoreductase domain 1 n=1 Tax=Tachypleus tridentatus TaxID=6853 RepID=UPI003FD63950
MSRRESFAGICYTCYQSCARNVRKITRTLENFDVEEKPSIQLEHECPNVQVIHALVTKLDSLHHELFLSDGSVVMYSKLCICTGGRPKLITRGNPYVLGIRDTETIKLFQERLGNSKRIVVVGNGGIAIELVYEIENCQVVWAIKHNSIGSTFFDAGAAEFFLPQLQSDTSAENKPLKRTKYTVCDKTKKQKSCDAVGSALGPDWATDVIMKGKAEHIHDIHVEYRCEVEAILTPDELLEQKLIPEGLVLKSGSFDGSWPVYVKLTNGKVYGCDFVVSATGVVSNVEPFLPGNQFELSEDGGLNVNDQLQTSIPDVYAAGDVCTCTWTPAEHWFQMKLWTQGKQMGHYAARCMASHLRGELAVLDFCFELFAHVTQFFGYKVVLLGLYNGQGLGGDYEILVRVTKGEEYVKVILKDGRMMGAVLIGDTDLEETFENLILNQMDLSTYGDELLNPNIDIEDYFD